MGDKLKSAAGLAFGAAVAIGLLALPFIFIKGAVWASEHLLAPLISVGWIAIAIVLLILLPLSIFKRLRGFAGAGIFIASCVFGLICWLMGVVVAYALWGLWAVIIGLLFLGGGVVPIGMIAALFKGEWQMLVTLVVLIALTFGSRLLAAFIAASAE